MVGFQGSGVRPSPNASFLCVGVFHCHRFLFSFELCSSATIRSSCFSFDSSLVQHIFLKKRESQLLPKLIYIFFHSTYSFSLCCSMQGLLEALFRTPQNFLATNQACFSTDSRLFPHSEATQSCSTDLGDDRKQLSC